MRRRHATRWAPLVAVSLAAATGCAAHTRFEPVRAGWAVRGGGHWAETALASVEVGPGGPRRQSVTVAATPRLLRGRDDEGRLEGALQVRLHLWRVHEASNLWVNSDRRFDPADPNLRRDPCGGHFHVREYDGRAFREAFSVGLLAEGIIGGSGRWVPNGRDSHGRPVSELSTLRLDGGVAAGAYARAVAPFGLSFNVDAGWEHAYGEGGPYLRAAVGFPFDMSVDRALPRM